MINRRPFHAPDAPDLPVVPRLQVQRATKGVRERVRWWIAGSGSVMALFLWAGLWLLVLPINGALLFFVGLPGALVLGSAVVYLNLPIVDEVSRFVFNLLSSKQELDLRHDSVHASIEALDGWGQKWNRVKTKKKQPDPVITRNRDKARLAAPGLAQNGTEATTQHLPELPAVPRYYSSAAFQIVAALTAEQRCTVREHPSVCQDGKPVSRAVFERAVAVLVRAEVVTQDGTRGLVLCPRYAAQATRPVLLHEIVCAVVEPLLTQ